jgi:phospholipid/cholesterol/gamma-HCH transport system substrate-binding protein
MSTRANHFKIGLFVIAGITILVGGIIVLGVGTLGKEKVMLETYLDESVQGLSVGSPVMQRGVKIGQVEEITFVPREYGLEYGTEQFQKYDRLVMVVMAVERTTFPSTSAERTQQIVRDFVKNGLRLKLASQGVTGIAYIEADFVEPERNPPMKIAWIPRSIYIPSMPSTLTSFTQSVENVFRTFEGINFIGTAKELEKAIVSLNAAVEGASVAKIQKEMVGLVGDLRQTNQLFMRLLDRTTVKDAPNQTDVVGLMASLDKAVRSLDGAIKSADVTQSRKEVVSLVSEFRQTNKMIQGLMTKAGAGQGAAIPDMVAQISRTLKRLEQFVSGRQAEIEEILDNVGAAAGNLRKLTETAKKYPAQLLFGDPPPRTENKE